MAAIKKKIVEEWNEEILSFVSNRFVSISVLLETIGKFLEKNIYSYSKIAAAWKKNLC